MYHSAAPPAHQLYIGIDIAKASHTAALLSTILLAKHGHYEACPTLNFKQSRAGFESLFSVMTSHAAPEYCHALLENTGHYGRALEDYLQEKGVVVYQVHVQEKNGKNKSDVLDARGLAVLLYNQVERQVLVSDKSQVIHRLNRPGDSARLLRGLVQHRQELVREIVRRKNKLTAIADELFPELTVVYKDPNSPTALALRSAFPTPQAIVSAQLEGLYATRARSRPSNAQFVRLKALASESIGTKDKSRVAALELEQKQLIIELTLLQGHVKALQKDIEQAVSMSRAGQILTSFPVIGPVHAALLIAGMGDISNFESAAKLRAYCGWAPLQTQTGTSMDTMTFSKTGNRLLKHTVFLIALSAVRQDTPWRTLYNRLVPLKCVYDDRLGRYRGRMKVIGRVAGQIIGVIYVLLKRDADVLASHTPGTELPPPELYSVTKHRVRPSS
jgi:transposase